MILIDSDWSWLVKRFLDHNSWTRFSPDMRFLQKVRRPLVLSLQVKKHIWIRFFTKSPPQFRANFGPSWPIKINFMILKSTRKIRKNWWAISEMLGCKRTDEQTSRTKFIGQFPHRGRPNIEDKKSEGKHILAKIYSSVTYIKNVYQTSKTNYIICCLRRNHETDINVT